MAAFVRTGAGSEASAPLHLGDCGSSHSFNVTSLSLNKAGLQRPLLVSGQRTGASRPGAGLEPRVHTIRVCPQPGPLLPGWGGTLKRQMPSQGGEEQENDSVLPLAFPPEAVGFQAWTSGSDT